jgi:hypothetical protein
MVMMWCDVMIVAELRRDTPTVKWFTHLSSVLAGANYVAEVMTHVHMSVLVHCR